MDATTPVCSLLSCPTSPSAAGIFPISARLAIYSIITWFSTSLDVSSVEEIMPNILSLELQPAFGEKLPEALNVSAAVNPLRENGVSVCHPCGPHAPPATFVLAPKCSAPLASRSFPGSR